MDTAARFLDGQMLIAMPGMGDPRFARAVIFLCAHSAEGAMGLIVNKPAPELRFRDLLKQLGIETSPDVGGIRVHVGGPVEHGRGFVLHSADYDADGASLRVSPGFAMIATLDLLQDMAPGAGPAQALLALGYSGWLIAAADPELVFGLRDTDKWEAALRSLNIDPRLLSAEGGRA